MWKGLTVPEMVAKAESEGFALHLAGLEKRIFPYADPGG